MATHTDTPGTPPGANPRDLSTRYFPAMPPIATTITRPGKTRRSAETVIQGKILGTMYLGREVHHYRVAGADGVLYFAPAGMAAAGAAAGMRSGIQRLPDAGYGRHQGQMGRAPVSLAAAGDRGMSGRTGAAPIAGDALLLALAAQYRRLTVAIDAFDAETHRWSGTMHSYLHGQQEDLIHHREALFEAIAVVPAEGMAGALLQNVLDDARQSRAMRRDNELRCPGATRKQTQ